MRIPYGKHQPDPDENCGAPFGARHDAEDARGALWLFDGIALAFGLFALYALPTDRLVCDWPLQHEFSQPLGMGGDALVSGRACGCISAQGAAQYSLF